MTIYQHLAGLIQQGIACDLIDREDRIYVQNQLLSLLKIDSFPESVYQATEGTIPNILDKIITYAIEQKVIDDVFDDKEILSAKLMNCFIARPSIVNAKFLQKYKESPETATDYFYELSKNSNYIQTKSVAKNVQFKTETKYGKMDITINLSKPEKDPEQIKRERELKIDTNYPKCLLCIENEGYRGRTAYPARSNHRLIRVPLIGENWYLQYSPYVYYNEHCILLSENHRDMKIDKQTFTNLLAFVEKFPHFFLGSNADLPIVGGSILSHDHYQGGNYEFAMTRAKEALSFELKDHTDVSASVLKWPLSVIRLRSKKKEQLIAAATHILTTWKSYSDELIEVMAFTNGTPHNTITPIARILNGKFELDLVLRNNRTTDEHPLGIFHPHADVHHVKRENIGLIEVMGLAVLPARLLEELREIKNYLLNKPTTIKEYHQDWAEQIKRKYTENRLDLNQLIQQELGMKFVKALEDAGVFKQNDNGMAAFRRFIQAINQPL